MYVCPVDVRATSAPTSNDDDAARRDVSGSQCAREDPAAVWPGCCYCGVYTLISTTSLCDLRARDYMCRADELAHCQACLFVDHESL